MSINNQNHSINSISTTCQMKPHNKEFSLAKANTSLIIKLSQELLIELLGTKIQADTRSINKTSLLWSKVTIITSKVSTNKSIVRRKIKPSNLSILLSGLSMNIIEGLKLEDTNQGISHLNMERFKTEVYLR